ncbi:type II secretion system protein GspC [Paraferrimonas haliotis]|uniref:Type II secretion system protein GspC n=1 Tax=Paraferrimonas haliotis TaxID=2013866 RepID=A0AA37TQE8_9GAMM|nr:type II secretion system protein GspC [Paraferrimonas haliotis]GLS83475.1 type II secretion system protein GspC [Paraferrimonas haliotis]
MDVLEKTLNQIKSIPQAPIASGAFAILLIIAIYLVAQISWSLIDTPAPASNWSPQITSSAKSTSVSVSKLVDSHLFGEYDKETAEKPKEVVVEQVIDAPKTSLSLLLTGVVASTEQTRGLAIIEAGGSQETYGIGDTIKGQSASIKEVYADRIIITNRGRYETLMLDGIKYTSQPSQPVKPRAAPTSRSNSRSVAIDRKELLKDPSKLTDIVSITPVTRSGETLGYRLNPGRDGKLFRDAGLKPNDLAKSINGYDLTDAMQAMELMSQLAELSDVSVMVERDGQLVEVNLSVPQ